jgi:hypothetical protein
MSSTVTQYATPPSWTAFSALEFSSITFQPVYLLYPKIMLPNSIISWCYSPTIPTSAAGTVITPSDNIPHSADLLPVFHGMEDAFILQR